MKKLCAILLLGAAWVCAADPTLSDILKAFHYRNLGPWRTGAWVSACAIRRRTEATCWGAWSVRADFFPFYFAMSALRSAAWVLLLLGVLAAS